MIHKCKYYYSEQLNQREIGIVSLDVWSNKAPHAIKGPWNWL